jgi:hypothetical protein
MPALGCRPVAATAARGTERRAAAAPGGRHAPPHLRNRLRRGLAGATGGTFLGAFRLFASQAPCWRVFPFWDCKKIQKHGNSLFSTIPLDCMHACMHAWVCDAHTLCLAAPAIAATDAGGRSVGQRARATNAEVPKGKNEAASPVDVPTSTLCFGWRPPQQGDIHTGAACASVCATHTASYRTTRLRATGAAYDKAACFLFRQLCPGPPQWEQSHCVGRL